MRYENTPKLQTERLVLRKFTADDAEALLELLSEEETNVFLPWFPLKSMEEAKTFLEERFLSYYGKPSVYRYAICLKEEDRPVGYVCLADNESHDFGYGLKKEYWHRGIASEAARAVVERVKDAGYLYITATHDVNNPRSGAVMRSLGMTYRYSYVEQWQPKDRPVTFRMYQLNFDGDTERLYSAYREQSKVYFVEKD